MGKPFNPLLGETYQLEQEHFRIVCEQVINIFKIEQQKNFETLKHEPRELWTLAAALGPLPCLATGARPPPP